MTALNDGFDQPREVAAVQLASGADLTGLLPDYNAIPANFRSFSGDKASRPWLEFQQKWFFDGITKDYVKPRADVDADTAWRHLPTIQGSWEPKHEHKAAAVAWLASRWFKAVAK